MDRFPEIKCTDGCPNSVSEELLNVKIRPLVDSLFNDKIKTAKIVIHEQDNLIFGYDIHGGVFTLCTKDILMVDFDNKDGISNELAIKYIEEYTNKMNDDYGYEMLFEMYETDRGVHAFLVNKLIDFTSPDAIRVMIDLCSDPVYIGYVEVRGFCIRLSPKIKNVLDISKTVREEFTARPMEKFRIGYGEVLKYSENVLKFHIRMVKKLSELYINNLDEFIIKTYIQESDTFDIFPSKEMFEYIKNFVVHNLEKLELYKPNDTFKTNIRRKIDDNIKIYDQKNLEVHYSISNKKFFLCSKHILKIKMELKNYQKMSVLNILNEKFKEFSFWVYNNSDDELIIYLVSDYDENFNRELLEKEIADKSIKIIFSNYCEDLNTNNNIIFKKKLNEIIEIGDVPYNSYIVGVLIVQVEIMNFITDLYDNYEIVLEKRYVNQVYAKVEIPSNDVFEIIRRKIIKILKSNNLELDEATFENNYQNKTLLNVNRYKDLFDGDFVNKYGHSISDEYGRRSVVQLEKRTGVKVPKIFSDEIPFKGIDHWISFILGPYLKRKRVDQIILLNGPIYPFILGFDLDKKMLYIRFFDLLMLDWDDHDGIPKESPIMIVDRFLKWQSNIPENNRVSKGDLCFKFYETDNGIHSYCVSHRMIYFSDNSSICMVHSAADFYYTTMSRFYGYSIRLSPKIFNGNSEHKTEAEIDKQFIQKEGVSCDYLDKLDHPYILKEKKKESKGEKKVFYFGNTKMIDPYLDKLTDLVFEIQNFVKRQENIGKSINEANIDFLENVRYFTSMTYNEKIRGKYDQDISKENSKWATGSNAYYYKKDNLTDVIR
jgi:hypothetical protein